MSHSLSALQSELLSAKIDVLRVIYADIIGTVRSKDLLVSELDKISHGGPAFCQGVWVTTTQGGVLDGADVLSNGLEDFISQIVPGSWRALPWEPGVAFVVAGANNPDGTPSPLSPRVLLERIVGEYAKLGLTPLVGPELEFYIADRNPEGGFTRALTQPGRVYTSGATVDPKGTFLHLLRMLDQLRIGVFAGNHEFSPSQYEINIWHGEALDACDRAFMLKAGVKDVIARVGQAATFAGKPWSDEGGSGFHLHMSLVDAQGENLMHEGDGLSPLAQHMIAGIVEHAAALTAFCNPTINAFKRLGPDTLAPYRANWGYDNRTRRRNPPRDAPRRRSRQRLPHDRGAARGRTRRHPPRARRPAGRRRLQLRGRVAGGAADEPRRGAGCSARRCAAHRAARRRPRQRLRGHEARRDRALHRRRARPVDARRHRVGSAGILPRSVDRGSQETQLLGSLERGPFPEEGGSSIPPL